MCWDWTLIIGRQGARELPKYTNSQAGGEASTEEGELCGNRTSWFSCVQPLPAVQFLYLKVRVEVEDDALRRLRRGDDPAAALVRRVLQRVAGRGDVAGVAGVQVAAARLGRWMGIGRETRLVSVASGSSTLRLNVLS